VVRVRTAWAEGGVCATTGRSIMGAHLRYVQRHVVERFVRLHVPHGGRPLEPPSPPLCLGSFCVSFALRAEDPRAASGGSVWVDVCVYVCSVARSGAASPTRADGRGRTHLVLRVKPRKQWPLNLARRPCGSSPRPRRSRRPWSAERAQRSHPCEAAQAEHAAPAGCMRAVWRLRRNTPAVVRPPPPLPRPAISPLASLPWRSSAAMRSKTTLPRAPGRVVEQRRTPRARDVATGHATSCQCSD
jgi:hypothetical protein